MRNCQIQADFVALGKLETTFSLTNPKELFSIFRTLFLSIQIFPFTKS